MGHSHLPVRHLLKQVEMQGGRRPRKARPPEWVAAFVDEAAELFEPLCEVGRVGFDCRLADDRWTVGLYLGTIEIVGGPEDGESRPAGFRFDLLGLLDRFDEVERFAWTICPESDAGDGPADRSTVVIDGRLGDRPLRVEIHARPPAEAGPGLRRYPDGRCDPV